ncbi:MAG: alanyl-tRNA editing protein [Nanoarchaeota archaeon]|nr:alanyl-tRNA editing protein [Nanoarchaeota archaeon]
MTKALYMDDCYLKEFDAIVASVKDDKYVVLDQTLFYPNSGGVEHDTGTLIKEDGTEFKVVFAGKFSGEISHEVDQPGLKPGDKVHGVLDWDRRYLLMRYHTAAHVLSGVFSQETQAQITGNQLTTQKGRIDFALDNFDREQLSGYFEKANSLIEKDLPIKIYAMSREEADPMVFKLAKAMPSSMKEFRIVDIEGFDRQADGGAHVKSLKEVGPLEFLKAENKGKNNRRVYFRIRSESQIQ